MARVRATAKGKAVSKIYVLKDPFTHDVRYVGVTSKALTERLRQHIYCATRQGGRGGKTPRDRWIRKLAKSGVSPVIEILETVTGEWQEREIYWIKYHKTYGSKLTNATIGGMGVKRK